MKRTWFDFWNELPGEGKIEFVIQDFYKMNLDDLYGVLQRCDISGRGVLEFCMNWVKPLMERLYTNLCLDDLFGPDPAAIAGYRMVSLPETEEDIMMWILRKFYLVYSDVTLENMNTPIGEFLDLKGMITQIEWQAEDEGLPVNERRYIDEIKRDFLMQYDNDLILSDAGEPVRELFRQFCDELADNGDMDALRIKGYACYGGNSVYECDWEAAAECMERLWKEGGFGYAANTLGYIYYYGRLSNNIPDYEKAFYYYSIGNTYGIIESGYKLADMFMYGHFVKQNIDMASSIIERFYGESRYRFEQGEFEGSFADIALRMGKLQLMKPSAVLPEKRYHAYRLFLQAEFALTMRMLETRQYGDQEVMKKIRKCLSDTYDSVIHRKSSVHIEFPYPLYELVGAHAYCIYNLNVKELKSGTKLKITRTTCPDNRDYDYTLITYPELSRCDLTDTVSVIAKDVQSKSENLVNDIMFDTIRAEGNGAIKTHRFYFRGECVYEIRANCFLLNIPVK